MKAWARLAPLLLAAPALPGCIGIQASSTPHYVTLLEKTPLGAETPIARELRYTYVENSRIDEKDNPWYAADPQTRAANPGVPNLALPSVAGPGGAPLSERYSQMARDYSQDGDHAAAADYHAMAESQARAEAQMRRTEAQVDMAMSAYQGILAAGAAWVQSDTDKMASRLATWARENTGAIAAEAPAGTVLHLDIRNVFTARSWQAESQRDFLVVATLERPGAPPLQATEGFPLFVHKAESKLDLPDELVVYDPSVFGGERKELFEPFAYLAYGEPMCVAINGAIAQLYERLRLETARP